MTIDSVTSFHPISINQLRVRVRVRVMYRDIKQHSETVIV